MSGHFAIISYGCYKAERRWLSGLVRAHSLQIPVPVNNDKITKPDLLCGELTQLVVNGPDTGLILTPHGHRVRLLVANPPIDKTLLDEVAKLNELLKTLQATKGFESCEMHYASFMAHALISTIGNQFDFENFKRNVG